MAIVKTKDGMIRFASVGDKLGEGEEQIFFRQGLNGGLIFDMPIEHSYGDPNKQNVLPKKVVKLPEPEHIKEEKPEEPSPPDEPKAA